MTPDIRIALAIAAAALITVGAVACAEGAFAEAAWSRPRDPKRVSPWIAVPGVTAIAVAVLAALYVAYRLCWLFAVGGAS